MQRPTARAPRVEDHRHLRPPGRPIGGVVLHHRTGRRSSPPEGSPPANSAGPPSVTSPAGSASASSAHAHERQWRPRSPAPSTTITPTPPRTRRTRRPLLCSLGRPLRRTGCLHTPPDRRPRRRARPPADAPTRVHRRGTPPRTPHCDHAQGEAVASSPTRPARSSSDPPASSTSPGLRKPRNGQASSARSRRPSREAAKSGQNRPADRADRTFRDPGNPFRGQPTRP